MPAQPSNAAQAATDDARFDSFARWTELRDRYFEVLRRVALPFFDAFPHAGWPAREVVVRELSSIDARGRARLFDD
jgi:hypothetical protein